MTDDGGHVGRRKILKILVGFGVALVLVYLLGVAVGWENTVERVRGAHLGWVGAAFASTVACLCVWALMWHRILAAMDVSVGYGHLVVTFFAASFTNYVTPMGQAGGEPIIAYILSRDTDAGYEQSLASVVTADVLRLLPFFNATGVGLAYVVIDSRLPGNLENLVIVLATLAVTLPVLVVMGWRYRRSVRRYALRFAEPIADRTERLSADGIAERIDRLYASVGQVADSPRTLLVSVGLGYVGWILFALPLYFSALALDVSVPLVLVAFLVPATVVVSFTPLPGGLGAIEGTLVVLLTALVAVSSADALAVTTVYRLTSYWIVILVGGIAALWVVARA
ncbi:MAG: YbhN family protein [Halobacteriales archaeon]